MAIHDFTSERLYVPDDLSEGAHLNLSEEAAHYLLNVMRAKTGDGLLVFNGRDGEWVAKIAEARKKRAAITVGARTRPQAAGPDVVYVFAPLKHARLDYMVQKAVEMGVAMLQPVMTRRTVAERINLDRMRANVIEAAEQCGVLRIPRIAPPVALTKLMEGWDAARALVFCDEGAEVKNPLQALQELKGRPAALLIGPEGGFDEGERQLLGAREFVIPISLGPRIMRADTAAVAGLALINAVLGDWN